MERSEDVILTNMCMVYDGNKVLVQEKILRGDRKKDRSKGIIFPGGMSRSWIPSSAKSMRRRA